MQIIKNLQNFLYDQDYFIDIYKNILHVYYYLELKNITNNYIELKLKEFTLLINGNNLTVKALDNHEILIEGEILKLEFKR